MFASVCYSVQIETTRKPSKGAAAKKTKKECFLFHVVTERDFLQKLVGDSFNRHIVAFFEKSVLKEVCILYISSTQCSANNHGGRGVPSRF